MKDNSVFFNWLTANHSNLNLVLTDLTWVKNWGADFYDYQASINLNGNIYLGRGVDKVSDLALIKSVAESLERSLTPSGQTSSGIAVHTNENEAARNAINELVEHELFLSYFNSKKNIPILKRPDRIYGTGESLIQRNYQKTDFFCMGFFKERYFVVAKYDFGDGFILGLGSHDDCALACEKAFFELVRKLSFYLKNPPVPLTLEDFKNTQHHTFEHHRLLSISKDYASRVSFLFEDKPDSKFIEFFYSINVETLQWDSILRELNVPLYAKRAISNNINKLYVGMPTFLNQVGVEAIPHPLG